MELKLIFNSTGIQTTIQRFFVNWLSVIFIAALHRTDLPT